MNDIGHTFSNGICRLAIRVKPNSQRSRLIGFNTERKVVEIALNAQPRDGEANAALIEFLKEFLKIPRDHIRIVSGLKSRDKIVEIECEQEDVEKLLRPG